MDNVSQNLKDNLQYLKLTHIYENYQEDDFATDNFDPGTVFDTLSAGTSVASVIPLTGSNQDYSGHLFMVFASYQFGK